MITPIRGRKQIPKGYHDGFGNISIRNDNPDKGTETKWVNLL